MSLIVFQDVSLSLGGKSIVENLDFRVGDHERIGLVGPNGSGKSTILRLIAGEQLPDGGQIHKPRGLRIGYLAQDVSVDGGRPLLTFVRDSVPGRAELDRSLEAAMAELEAAEHEAPAEDREALLLELAGRVAELHEEIAHFDAHYSEFEAKGILAGLGFKAEDLERDLGEFSGGWKMRAVLAALLFQRPDLLLLDEPTNHLDMPSVAWFSSFLKRYDRSFLLISHDREFLNEQIHRVVSLEPEGVRTYQGDYESYRRQRAEERVLLESRAKNLEREREHLEQFIKRFRAKATKAAQVQSRVRALEKMETVDLHQDRAVMSFRFPPSERTGKDVLVTHGLRKSYGAREVLSGVDLRVERGDRIALLGVNGAGKTTLLRILAGEIEASGGTYEFGHNTKVGYYAQHHAESLDRTRSVYDEVARCCRDGGHQRIRSVLGAMLFGDLEIEKKVGVLSGGERARVALSQLLVDPGNVLLMDEPTNHLDLDSSERLAEALSTFDGTLLFVSHNRAFIRALANKIWFVDGGRVDVYPGTFDDYIAACQLRDAAPAAATQTQSPDADSKRPNREEEKARKRDEARLRSERNKKLRPLERRIAELEARIAKLEEAQKKRTDELSDPAVYQDAARRDALMQAFSREKAELEVATDTWMEVQEELEALRSSLEE
ncbi:MAG: ABC-F family ATP-binding cassette domain-containing protein [Polyangiaceae bacterium]|nr:ABC-F family ATP-binding cassette domain-containing protein [Polyangiaceae bacterium]